MEPRSLHLARCGSKKDIVPDVDPTLAESISQNKPELRVASSCCRLGYTGRHAGCLMVAPDILPVNAHFVYIPRFSGWLDSGLARGRSHVIARAKL